MSDDGKLTLEQRLALGLYYGRGLDPVGNLTEEDFREGDQTHSQAESLSYYSQHIAQTEERIRKWVKEREEKLGSVQMIISPGPVYNAHLLDTRGIDIMVKPDPLAHLHRRIVHAAYFAPKRTLSPLESLKKWSGEQALLFGFDDRNEPGHLANPQR